MTPRVSAVLTTYNGATRGFLRNAIESVIEQSYADFELLIVDDGSTDNTAAICQEYGGPNIRYIHQANAGVAVARNTGIDAASGEFVCFLDDDDEWLASKLERQVEILADEPDVGLVYSAIELVDQRGGVVGLQRSAVPADAYRSLFFFNFVDATSSVMVRATVLLSVGGFLGDVFGPTMQGCEDRDLWIRIARSYRLVGIPEPLVRYRLPGGREQLSRNVQQMERSEMKMLDLALADAPPEIAAMEPAIRSQTLKRIAMEYFGAADYEGFRRLVDKLAPLGGIDAGLRARVWLSYAPATVRLARAIRGISRPGNFR